MLTQEYLPNTDIALQTDVRLVNLKTYKAVSGIDKGYLVNIYTRFVLSSTIPKVLFTGSMGSVL